MIIYNIQTEKQDSTAQEKARLIQTSNPNFKGIGAPVLNAFGSSMQWIEDKGFLASFLIQDVLGMTVPRVGAGFLRDKEVTGQYNMQEGFEVLGREGLTGPCMMAVAPIMFAIASKFGHSTSANSALIKRFGNKLKQIVGKSSFDKNLLNNKEQFKKEFYAINIQEILENTLGKENVTDKVVKDILEQIANYEKIPQSANTKGLFGKSKYRKECLSKISDIINDIKYKTSSDLESVYKVKVGSADIDKIKEFKISDAIEAMIKYSDDAILFNKHLNKLDDAMAENIKNESIAKRFIANISTMAATLGVLSVLPKIYARSSISPGAKTAMKLKEAKEENKSKDSEQKSNEINFKGRGNNKKTQSLLSKLGQFISDKMKDFATSELEYNGHNFTNTLMAGLSLFGLLAPRGLRAYNRAQVDEDGKKDLTELWEILIRDVTSSLAVVFAVPMLTRAAVTSYEKNSGFVLMNKDRSKSKFATVVDLFNPYSKSKVLTNAEIQAIYNGVDTKEKMINFCKYIDKNNGDLEKILSKAENIKLLEEKGLKLDEIKKLKTSKDKNKKIIDIISTFSDDSNSKIAKVMKNAKKPSTNNILRFARGLNSIPGIIATVFISPYILGWLIPRITYANTRRIHAKKEEEKQKNNSINTSI